jgi:hypothetical protein
LSFAAALQYIGKKPEAGHILYLRILYPIHIQAPKKDFISYHGKTKDMDIYPISFVKKFASIVTVSEQQKALALQHTIPRLFTRSN